MRLRPLLLVLSAPIFSSCAPQAPIDAPDLSEIAGSWTGGEVFEVQRPDSQVVFFSVRPDSSLFIPMIYEVGPRSRLWSYDIEVTYRDGRVSWDHHRGHLSPGRDTMWVSKNYRGDRSEWMWVRDPEADALMERLLSMEEVPFKYQSPLERDDGWECAQPGGVGLDAERLLRFLTGVAEGDFGDIHSFLLVKNGTLVVEEYFGEQGRKHGPFIRSVFQSRVHHLASATKSIVSTLMGIAIGKGFISSEQDPIVRYLPTYARLLEGEKEAITIEHLLTMTSGLEWSTGGRPFSRNDNAALWSTDDVVGYVLEKPLVAEPGRRFVYSNGSAAVVGAILENATGMELGRFAEEYLFGPLGITDYLWTAFPDGTVASDGGLALRPRDLAKIGQTFLDGGRWRNEQIVPAAWVDEATRQRLGYGSSSGAPLGYGYFWMQTDLPAGDTTVRSFFHPGDGGQILMVIPELDMVAVFTAGTYGTDPKREYIAIMRDHVLPAVVSLRMEGEGTGGLRGGSGRGNSPGSQSLSSTGSKVFP